MSTTNLRKRKSAGKRLILWGSHPQYCAGAWLKLCDHNWREYCYRLKCGFSLLVLRQGETP